MATPLRRAQETRPVRPVPVPPRPARRPIRDNPRLLLVGIALLVIALAGLLALAGRTTSFSPDFLTEVVLYALSVADLTMLVALVFVLARNIIKLVVERRRGLPFARFRAKLVAVLLGMTLIPSILVLIVGSELIRNSADRWFNAPMDEVLSSANRIASDYYAERQRFVVDQAGRIAKGLSSVELSAHNVAQLQTRIAPEVAPGRLKMVEIFRLAPEAGLPADVAPVLDVASPTLPPGASQASAERLASRVAAGATETWVLEPVTRGGELIRGAAAIRNAAGRATGVVVASDYLTGDLAARSRRMTAAYEDYRQLRVLKAPLFGVYVSFFLMVTLLILVGATWMGLYLAKRITRPVQLLSAAAREIGAGHLDHRVEPETQDEFGALIEAFNSMAGELAESRRELERSAGRSGTEAPRRGRPAPLHRDDSRAHRHGRRLVRRVRRDRHRQRIRTAPAGRGSRRDRQAGIGGLLARRSRAAGGAPSEVGKPRCRNPAAGSGAGPRRARAASGRDVNAPCRRGRPSRGHRARLRRRDTAHSVAEGRRVA